MTKLNIEIIHKINARKLFECALTGLLLESTSFATFEFQQKLLSTGLCAT